MGFGRAWTTGLKAVAVEESPAKEPATEELAAEELTLDNTRAGCDHEVVADIDSDATSELALSL
ncbi:MAG: hypothetical protein AAF268_07425 [Cyanobacteria bacterium P01_A01_bin.3]